MLNRFAAGARSVVKDATKVARELGSPTVEAEHLLLAVTRATSPAALVLGRIARVRDVAGHEHRRRRRPQRQHPLHRRRQRGLRGLVIEPEVRIGELGDQEHVSGS